MDPSSYFDSLLSVVCSMSFGLASMIVSCFGLWVVGFSLSAPEAVALSMGVLLVMLMIKMFFPSLMFYQSSSLLSSSLESSSKLLGICHGA